MAGDISPNLRGLDPFAVEPRKVEKPWGWELVWAHTEHYVGKLLFVRSGQSLSLQFHNEKDESWYVHEGRAELQLSGMPNPPAGRVWQLWIQRDGQAPKPGPVFELGSGAVALPAGAAARGARVMVTDESPGGSARPSTQPVLVARL